MVQTNMAASRIHILPHDSQAPLPAAAPVEHARRWLSPYEEPGSQTPVAVFVTQSAYAHVVVHAASELDIEVGGVLVGKWCTDVGSDRQFVVVETALPARFTRQGSVFLTFTQDSLVDLHAEIEANFQGKQIVGWYHTHPRLGVFLSQYDTWLHTHFFPEPWQVALVVEPLTDTGGFFIRQGNGELNPSQYYGFYELDGSSGRSLVHWHNLQRAFESDEQKGDGHDE
jgi:proteasome lid subunit RPN8/RPN11